MKKKKEDVSDPESSDRLILEYLEELLELAREIREELKKKQL